MTAIVQSFCSHNYAIDIYNQIAQREITLVAYKDAQENIGVPDVPDEMIVGHHSLRNACGVFYANTDNSKQNRRKRKEQKYY